MQTPSFGQNLAAFTPNCKHLREYVLLFILCACVLHTAAVDHSSATLPTPVVYDRRKHYWRAKYELVHVVRTHMGANDARYGCVFQREDTKGRVGVHLSKELMAIAGHALKANITTLGPLVLPISEQLIFFGNLVARKVRSHTCMATVMACLHVQHIYFGDLVARKVSNIICTFIDVMCSHEQHILFGSVQKAMPACQALLPEACTCNWILDVQCSEHRSCHAEVFGAVDSTCKTSLPPAA